MSTLDDRRRSSLALRGGPEPESLADVLERVLDKGIVIAGDIRINLLDIELLTVKLRLLVTSADKAKELGIDWWQHDPFLTGGEERKELEERIERLEGALDERGPEGAHERDAASDGD